MIPVSILPAVAHPWSPAEAGAGVIDAMMPAATIMAISFFITCPSFGTFSPHAGINPAGPLEVPRFSHQTR
jgi:hypothetical protein